MKTMEDKDRVKSVLSHEEMDKIESQVVSNTVGTPSIEDTDDILGVDDDEITKLFAESENIAGKICKNIMKQS